MSLFTTPQHLGESHESGAILAMDERMPILIPMTGGGQTVYNKYEADITWLAKSESQVVIAHGGIELKRTSNFNDFYGFLTSLENACDELNQLKKRYQVTASSSLEMFIETKLISCAFLSKSSDKQYNTEALSNNLKLKLVGLGKVDAYFALTHPVIFDNYMLKEQRRYEEITLMTSQIGTQESADAYINTWKQPKGDGKEHRFANPALRKLFQDGKDRFVGANAPESLAQ